jgi:hypothetical protein
MGCLEILNGAQFVLVFRKHSAIPMGLGAWLA